MNRHLSLDQQRARRLGRPIPHEAIITCTAQDGTLMIFVGNVESQEAAATIATKFQRDAEACGTPFPSIKIATAAPSILEKK